jgi:hypothetical protein
MPGQLPLSRSVDPSEPLEISTLSDPTPATRSLFRWSSPPHRDCVGPLPDYSPGVEKLIDLWMHQNALAWSRAKAAAVLQAFVIAVWYYAMTDDLPEVALPLASAGALLTVTLAFLAHTDISTRNDLGAHLAAIPLTSGGGRLGLGIFFGVLLAIDLAMTWTAWKAPHSMAAPTDDSYESTSRLVVAKESPRPRENFRFFDLHSERAE